MVGLDVNGILDLAGGFDGLYFETGQGSAVTNGTAGDVDMVTLESRAYGVARLIRQDVGKARRQPPWMIVNDVAGFIGPEVFRTAEQLERSGSSTLRRADQHDPSGWFSTSASFSTTWTSARLRRPDHADHPDCQWLPRQP